MGQASALPQTIKGFGIKLARGPVRRIHYLNAVENKAQLGRFCRDRGGVSEEDRISDFFVRYKVSGAENLLVVALWEDHATGRRLSFADHDTHHFMRLA